MNNEHYYAKIEPIEFITKNKLDFVKGNLIKYSFRAGLKSGQEKDDIYKIIDYALILSKQLGVELEKSQIEKLLNKRGI